MLFLDRSENKNHLELVITTTATYHKCAVIRKRVGIRERRSLFGREWTWTSCMPLKRLALKPSHACFGRRPVR